MKLREPNPLWAPIEPLRLDVAKVAQAYRAAPPVRVARSQRYSLVLTEPCPEPVWRRP